MDPWHWRIAEALHHQRRWEPLSRRRRRRGLIALWLALVAVLGYALLR